MNTIEDAAVEHGRKMYQMGREHERETVMSVFEKLQESVDKLVKLTEENSTDIHDLLHNRTLK